MELTTHCTLNNPPQPYSWSTGKNRRSLRCRSACRCWFLSLWQRCLSSVWCPTCCWPASASPSLSGEGGHLVCQWPDSGSICSQWEQVLLFNMKTLRWFRPLFSFLGSFILYSFLRLLSSRLCTFHRGCKRRRQGSETGREDSRQQAFNKLRHPCFGAIILKRHQLNMTCLYSSCVHRSCWKDFAKDTPVHPHS